jgi:hypothetical protein
MSRDLEWPTPDATGPGDEAARPRERKRIRVLNGGAKAGGDDLMPLSACDCDNHSTCDVHTDVCGADEVDVDVDAQVCGIWG